MKLCMWRHTAPRNCGWVCAAKGSEQERKVLYAIASLDKPSSRKEITNFIEMCNLGLSVGRIGQYADIENVLNIDLGIVHDTERRSEILLDKIGRNVGEILS